MLSAILQRLKRIENTSIGEADPGRTGAGAPGYQQHFDRHLRTIQNLETSIASGGRIMLYLRSFETDRKIGSTRVADPVVPGRVYDTLVDPRLQEFLSEAYSTTHQIVTVEDTHAYQESLASFVQGMDEGAPGDLGQFFRIFSALTQFGGLTNKLFVANAIWLEVMQALIPAAHRIVILFDGMSDGLSEEMDVIQASQAERRTLLVMGNRFQFQRTVQLPPQYQLGQFPYMVGCWDVLKGRDVGGSEGARSTVPVTFGQRSPDSVLTSWIDGELAQTLNMARYYFDLGEDAETRGDVTAAVQWFQLAIALSRHVGEFDAVERGNRNLLVGPWGVLGVIAHSQGDFETALVRYREFEIRHRRGDSPVNVRAALSERQRQVANDVFAELAEALPQLIELAETRQMPPPSWLG